MNDNEMRISRETSGFFVASWRSMEQALRLLAGTPEREEMVEEAIWTLRQAQDEGVSQPDLLLRLLAATAFLTDSAPLTREAAIGIGAGGSTPFNGWR